MSTLVEKHVWERQQGGAGWSTAELAVMVAMARCARDDGSGIRPRLQDVATSCGLSLRGVRGIVRRLEDGDHLILVEESAQHRPAEYAINVRPLYHVSDRLRAENARQRQRNLELEARLSALQRLANRDIRVSTYITREIQHYANGGFGPYRSEDEDDK